MEQQISWNKQNRWIIMAFWAIVFLGVFLVCCQIGYSDGDDAFFYQYSHEMGFFEYLSWRYESWVGRMGAESLIYLVFRSGIWVWRIGNAGMLLLLPLGVLTLAKKVSGQESPLNLWESLLVLTGYLMMSVMTAGYAGIWINGSIFYTWSFACGIWAMVPLADFVFQNKEVVPASGTKKMAPLIVERSSVRTWCFLPLILLCSVLGAMAIEQMGAVLLAFLCLGQIFAYGRTRRISIPLILQTLVTLTAFAFLFAAPGNDIRVADEILTWMPQYETLSFGEHLFLVVQWLLSSFANENKMFLAAIWILGILLLEQKETVARKRIWQGVAGIFCLVSMLPFFGVSLFSDLGITGLDYRICLTQVPLITDLSGIQLFAIAWWAVALIFTFLLLIKVLGWHFTALFTYLGGIASEAILFFSPTIYASGERVYYLTDWMYWFLILLMMNRIKNSKRKQVLVCVFLGVGIFHFCYQLPQVLQMI